jgi:CRISPR/Cas system CSM-associated protein Csm3 (group 7 of RAMP superfamily)
MKQYSAQITLTVLGPLLTASTGVEQYGLQKAFHRNSKNEPVIPASHIRGKLKMAFEELTNALEDFEKDKRIEELKKWFGRRSEDNPQKEGYEPAPGILRFSDFSCQLPPGLQASATQSQGQEESSDLLAPLRRRSRITIHQR